MGKINDSEHPASFDVGAVVEASGFSPEEFADIAATFIGDWPRLAGKVFAVSDPACDPLPVVLHEVANSLRSVGAERMAAAVVRREHEARLVPLQVDAQDLQEVVAMLSGAAQSLQAWLRANGLPGPFDGQGARPE